MQRRQYNVWHVRSGFIKSARCQSQGVNSQNCELATTHEDPSMSCRPHPKFCFEECTRQGHNCPHLKPRIYCSAALVTGFQTMLNNYSIVQLKAIQNWDSLTSTIRTWDGRDDSIAARFNNKTGDTALFEFLEVFDCFFFRGALRRWVTIKFIPFSETIWGLTRDDQHKKNHVIIEMNRPRAEWTKAIFQRVMSTILHEMTHAIFWVFHCRKPFCESPDFKARHQGTHCSGHGPSWRRLGQSIEREANRSLRAVEGHWDMDVHGWGASHQLEIKRIVEGVINQTITRAELSKMKDAMFSWDL